jgi:signal peptidase I
VPGLVVALMPVAVFVLATQVVGSLWFKPYRVPSTSMVATIDVGDRVLADRHDKSPRVGDIVIAHPPVGALEDRCGAPQRGAPCGRATPELSDDNFIKRVVAGPGDTIAFRHGIAIRNGRAADEPYARGCTDRPCELPTAITVPAGTWFLAGDDRGASDDSRFWGPVPTDAGHRQVPLLAAEESRTPVARRPSGETGQRATLVVTAALLHSAFLLC